jgi:hypothetical protein
MKHNSKEQMIENDMNRKLDTEYAKHKPPTILQELFDYGIRTSTIASYLEHKGMAKITKYVSGKMRVKDAEIALLEELKDEAIESYHDAKRKRQEMQAPKLV